ncbi:neuropeptide FF receptor 2-like isoform X2 [Stylophora pistillata]|nr:neuropeptide FF receptor 2-like isoform X2 [Stylophora pistillata]
MSGNLNTSINGTHMHLHCFNPTVNKVVETLFDCAIFVFSLVGNSLISIIVFKSRAMRKPINFLIVNMAMSDLLFAIFVVPPNLVGMHFQTSFLVEPQGEVFCKLVEFMIHVSASVSVQSLVLIAVDRFGAVVYPLRPPLITSKLCCFLIVATWIISFGIYSPYFLGSHL